jgi:uncharacterized protein involved in exopolysaccharide biosynthesis
MSFIDDLNIENARLRADLSDYARDAAQNIAQLEAELAAAKEGRENLLSIYLPMKRRAESAEAELTDAQKQIAMDTVRFLEMQAAGHRMEAELAAARTALRSACTRAQSALVCTIEHDQFRLLESLCDELVIATSAAKEAP